MFHLGVFESSLRNSDGGKKYAARKKKENAGKTEIPFSQKNHTNKARGALKNKEKDGKKKNKDQCVPKSDESLTDSAVEIDHKVPGSSQEPSIDDSIGLSESDNEKLKSNSCDNCLTTREALNFKGGDNEIASFADAVELFISCERSRSWECMKPKKLRIRGPFGSLVYLSCDRDRLRLAENKAKDKRVSLPVDTGKVTLSKTKTKDNQSEEELLKAIETLSKRAEDEADTMDIFEDLDVEEFENERVSKLFENYFNEVETKEKNDVEDFDSILNSLIDFESQKNRNRKKSSSLVRKKSSSEKKRHCKSHLKDEEIIRNILPATKDILAKTKKNAELERKWIPGGILKRSSHGTDTPSNTRLCLNNCSSTTFKKDSQKSPQGSTICVVSKNTESFENKKNFQNKSAINQEKSNEIVPNLKKSEEELNSHTEKHSKSSKQKSNGDLAAKTRKRSLKNETPVKSNESNKKPQLKTSPKCYSPRCSFRKSSKLLDQEFNLNSDLNNSKMSECKKSETTNKDDLHVNGLESSVILDKISNFTAKTYRRNVLENKANKILRSERRGKVQKLISDFELNSLSGNDMSRKHSNDAIIQELEAFGQYKDFEEFQKAKTEEDLANERAWLDAEKLWLVHKGGFTAVRVLPTSDNHQSADTGKVKVKVEKTNEILEVDEDDLEKTNPAQLDQIEDISQLRYINESSVLYILRQRFGNNLIHTYAAGNLIVINPQCTLSIYNEKVAALFRGCKSEDMPPHIYAMAQSTYRSMLSTRKDQSIVLLGRSGSGKTHNFRHILSYLLHSAGAVNKVLNVEKLNALHTVLEAFGNARSCLNVNATKCTNLLSLDFDQTGQIASLSVQMLMLEKQRVAKRPEGEGTFNVFYWLLAGAEGSLAKQLFLDSTAQDSNLFINSLSKIEDRQRAIMELSKLTLALKALGVTEKECFVLWSVLAAIYHLGNAGTVRVGTNKWQFADPVHSSKACRLLGSTTEELSQTIWSTPGSPSRTPSPEKDRSITGVEALEGFVIGLYSEVVNVVNNLINRCLTTNAHSTISFIVIDTPGFQNPSSCGQQRGATFSDLCQNYVQERLHLLFHSVNLVAPLDRYTQEHIDVNTEEIFADFNSSNQLVSILDKSPPSGVLKTSQTDLREVDRRGLLWLLDEETLYPNSSDETFLERLFQHYNVKEHQAFIKKSGSGHFVIQHLQGTNPVTYNAHGLLKASKENPVTRAAISFLQESSKEEISELFVKGKGGLLSAGAEGSQSLRRVSSIRRTCSVAVKRKSISLQVKFTTDSLIETLRRTSPRFVFCMLPHHNAGNTEIIPGPAIGDNSLNVPLLRSQLRGSEILPAVRLFKQGFPEYYPHGEFRRRFRMLASGNAPSLSQSNTQSGVKITINGQSEALDEARAVEEMLLQMDVDSTSYRIGLSQVFFRAGVLAQLESQRDEKLADLVIQLQSRCRGYLARKKLAKLKVQDLAVRCIQRNVRKLMQVREWPWWRLYVKVTPLLNVHRTEEELTAKIKELETLKSTLEKLEQERNQLKLENDKLETKVGFMKERKNTCET